MLTFAELSSGCGMKCDWAGATIRATPVRPTCKSQAAQVISGRDDDPDAAGVE